ncbi:hypothetical protein EON63_15470 [archaeon]|nr:MAG: hypothetical protein EON63_15470 [archaeon]
MFTALPILTIYHTIHHTRYHPDKHRNHEEQKINADIFIKVTQAYEVLGDADKRREYNEGMVYGVWYMVYGIWYMVYGIWCMVYGI